MNTATVTQPQAHPVTITSFRQAMQQVLLERRFRSSFPSLSPAQARAVSPVVAGVPAALRPVLGRNQVTHSFPLDRLMEPTGVIGDGDLDLIRIENSRFRVLICPSLGGRILSMVDQATGGELLFQPPMILNRSIGLAGAWHVGGIEVNAFRYGHLLMGQSRLRTERVRLASGHEALRSQAVDERAGCSLSVTLVLLPDRLAMRVRLENHSPSPQSGYYWTNIALCAHPWMQIFLPPGPMLNHGQARPGYTDNVWPHIDGVDCRLWQRHHEIMSAYAYAPRGDWMGTRDQRSGQVFAHRALRQDHAGRKLWSLGSGAQDRVWFDSGVGEAGMGSYVELQSGRLSTQTHADLIEPGCVREWTEEFTGAVFTTPTAEAVRSDVEYAAFVAAVEAGLDAEIPVRDPGFWTVVDQETLVEPDARMDLSQRVTLDPASLSDDDLRAAARGGWVAGAAWIAALDRLEARGGGDGWTRLAAAVAATDLRGAVDPRLESLARGDDEVAAWAAHVLAAAAPERAQALDLSKRAARLAPDQPSILAAHGQRLIEARDFDAVLALADGSALTGTEDARALQAEVAFLRGSWEACRDVLEAPFLAQGEGQFRLWAMRKEADLVEGLTVFRDQGDVGRALALIHEACRLRPQFGIGRDESAQSGDALFYRWAILRLAGRDESAALAATQVLRYGPIVAPNAVGTSAWAYALRLALLTGSPCAAARIQACEAWGRDAVDDPRSAPGRAPVAVPWSEGGVDLSAAGPFSDDFRLRRCVLRAAGGRSDAFADLADHRLFGHRAALETWLGQRLAAHING